jgi:hypothetical protein
MFRRSTQSALRDAQSRSFGFNNGPPMRMRDLRGKLLLLDVWNFECWNCYRSFPWLKQLEERYESTLTPEPDGKEDSVASGRYTLLQFA